MIVFSGLRRTGSFWRRMDRSGDGDGEFHRPSSVAVDSDGNIYVADWGNQRVQILDADGNFLVKLQGEATLSKWSEEYLDAQQDEFRARSTFEPYFEVDTDDKAEIAARIEPYFWDPVTVAVDKENRCLRAGDWPAPVPDLRKGELKRRPHPDPLPPSGRGEMLGNPLSSNRRGEMLGETE